MPIPFQCAEVSAVQRHTIPSRSSFWFSISRTAIYAVGLCPSLQRAVRKIRLPSERVKERFRKRVSSVTILYLSACIFAAKGCKTRVIYKLFSFSRSMGIFLNFLIVRLFFRASHTFIYIHTSPIFLLYITIVSHFEMICKNFRCTKYEIIVKNT